MAAGYIEYSDNTGTAVSSTSSAYDQAIQIALTAPASQLALPTSGCKWSHLEITLKENASQLNCTDFKVFLAWDNEGKHKIAGPSGAVTLHKVTVSTVDYGSASIDLNIVPTLVSDGTAGTVYLYFMSNNSTDDKLIRARLHWYELSKG
tara:strand:+ start:208 stop:654 length:447 start_codon:yes stop_codon:yes gene_type:complete